MEGTQEIRRRVISPSPNYHPSIIFDNVIDILADTTRQFILVTYGEFPTVAAAQADDIVAAAPLVISLEQESPHIVKGPLSRDHQIWATAGPTQYTPHRTSAPPDAGSFRAIKPGTVGKPAVGGLYTSSRLTGSGDDTMWSRYVTCFGGSLFPEPRTNHHLLVAPDAKVYEVSTAAAWVDLLSIYGFENSGLRYPDWQRLAADYDAVHLCLAAILAIQGLVVIGASGQRIAPFFWDVESTLWLKWMFQAPPVSSPHALSKH